MKTELKYKVTKLLSHLGKRAMDDEMTEEQALDIIQENERFCNADYEE
jgi:hypothetical protein